MLILATQEKVSWDAGETSPCLSQSAQRNSKATLERTEEVLWRKDVDGGCGGEEMRLCTKRVDRC